MSLDNAFIGGLLADGGDLRVAVKDCIDLAGIPTSVGSRAIADIAQPAGKDAACMAGARAAGATIVGKTNLTELCHSGSGINPYFGTPVNPVDPRRVPGGSSSGSAVAVATGMADVAFGTDTTGSVRIPAAACGVAGLKTTNGRVPLTGVHPLVPSLDAVGVLARDVAGLARGLQLLLPDEPIEAEEPELVLRIRTGVSVRPEIDAAVDAALAAAGFATRDQPMLDWWDIGGKIGDISDVEAYQEQGLPLLELWPELDPKVVKAYETGRDFDLATLEKLRGEIADWVSGFVRLLAPGVVLAIPTLIDWPPLREDTSKPSGHRNGAVNAAGLPAICLPASREFPFASLQFIGAAGTESMLIAAACRAEAAIYG